MNDWFEAEKRVERAHELYESGRWEEALRELRAALRVNPNQPEWQYNLGVTLEAMGRFADAIDAFKHTLDHEGEDVELLNILGINCTRIERYADALGYLERAEQLDSTEPASYINRIETYTALGEHDQARTMFYMALQVAEDEPPKAFLNMAAGLLVCGEIDRALWCLEQVQRLDPNEEQLHARLGNAWRTKGDTEKAYASYIEHLRREPGDTETLLDLGNLLVEMNRPSEAAEKFRRAIELEPANADAHFCLGQLALMADHPAAAKRSFQMTLQIRPDRPEANQRLAAIALIEGDADLARQHLQAELEIHYPHRCVASEEELGRLLLDAQMAVQAAEVYARVVRLRPDDAKLHHQFAVALFLTGHTESGVRHCRRAVKLDDQFLLAMHNLTVASMQLGQWRHASYWLNRAKKISAKDRRMRSLRRELRAVIFRDNVRAFMQKVAGRRAAKR